MLGFFSASAQDIHFTQFFAAPMFTNPALTGHFDGTYRFSGIIRQQWRSVSPQPFSTFGGGVDMNGPFKLKAIGIGFHLAQDQAGLSALTTTQANVFLAGRIPLSPNIKLHLGAELGGFQQVIDYSKLSFGEQYNGVRFDPEIATTDVAGRNTNIANLNMGLGGYLDYRLDERRRIGLGYALYNVLEPDRSFSSAYPVPVLQRHSIHLLSSFPISSTLDLMPAAQFLQQGKQNEFLIGSALRYHLNPGPIKPQSVQIGLWGRTGDAMNVSMGFQSGNLYLGAAYDVNLSTLQPASSYRGGWEVAVIYTLSTVQENVKRLRQCPDYL